MRILSISLILIFGLASLWFASQSWGIGYDPDSIIYEDVAENWVAGYGIARFDFTSGDRYPMTNFPPLYPLILGVLSQIFGTVANSARLLNTALWGGLWLMVYAWIYRGLRIHKIAWCFATILMVNLMVLQVFGTSWSEPLFMTLGFSGLWVILKYHQTWQWRHLILASSLFACAILTRYAGVAFVLTTAIILFAATQRSWRDRIQSLTVLGFVSGLPLFIWLLRNVSVRGDVANRNIGFTMLGLPQLESTFQTIGIWLIPIPDLTFNMVILGFIGVLLCWTIFQTRKHQTPIPIASHILRWWIVIYTLFILASFSLIDPRIPFNYRILLPAYVGIIMLVGRHVARHWTHFSRFLRITWIVTALVLIGINGLLGLNWAVIMNRTGQQYSSSQFQKSPIIQALHESPPSATIYTNNNFLYHYLTDSPAHTLPSANDTNFDEWLGNLPDENTIQIVFFGFLSQREWESTEQIESLLPLTVIHTSDVVTVYQLEQPNE